LLFCQNYKNAKLEQLQQFGKPTWHPYNFGKTRKIGSNSLANQLGKNRNLAKFTADRGCHRCLPLGGRVKKK
jgi:hypothetical protein